MPTNETAFKIGDCVRVRAGTQDADWGADLSGWQGRVLNIERPKRGSPTVLVAWDSVTLRQMSAASIEACEVEGLDWTEYALDADQVEIAACRDTPRDVDRAKKEIGKQYRWVYLGEEGKRMHKVLAGIDPDEEMRVFERWGEYFEQNLAFPFDAIVAEYKERGPLRSGDKVKVSQIELVDDSYGVIAGIWRGRKKFAVPLCDLEVIPKNSPNYQMVKDYAIWLANR